MYVVCVVNCECACMLYVHDGVCHINPRALPPQCVVSVVCAHACTRLSVVFVYVRAYSFVFLCFCIVYVSLCARVCVLVTSLI